MKLTFFGAAQEVTGSCMLLDTGRTRVVIDCGLFQGGSLAYNRNLEAFPFDPKTVDAVILTHAHIDHIGRFPKLVLGGFSGRTFCTHPTRLLTKLMWIDQANVMKEDAKRYGKPPMYLIDQIWPAYDLLHGVDYDTPVKISDDVHFRLREAGHIFGSSFVELEAAGRKFVFSGDLGNDQVPILRPTEPHADADVVIMESTYGDRQHEAPSERKRRLRQAVKDTVKKKGVLMIPAFSLERTQEILYELNELVETDQVPRIPFFLDSPLAMKVLPVYQRFPQYYNREAKELARRDDFFNFPGLKITRRSAESEAISQVPSPKVIIAGSGMMHGGRIMSHLVHYLNNPRNLLLVIGFQAAGTIGRAVLEGANRVHIDHQEVLVKAKVEIVTAYSAHADQTKLLKWLTSAKQRPERVFLSHGEVGALEVLAGHVRQGKGIETVISEFGKEYEI